MFGNAAIAQLPFTTEGGGLYAANIDETASGADSPSAAATFLSSLSETASGVDTPSTAVTFASSLSESSSGTDTPSAAASFASSISESASGADDSTASLIFVTAISESASGDDSISSAVTFSTAISESAAGADTTLALTTFASNITETASALDSDSAATVVFFADIAESVDASDSAVFFENSGFSVPTFAGSPFAGDASFVVSLSATVSVGASIDESGSALDEVTGNFAMFIAEDASAQDDPAASVTFSVSLSETASALDAVTSTLVFAADISEAASGADAVSSSPSFISSIDEAGSGADSVATTQTFSTEIAESGAAEDTPSSIGVFNIFVDETVSATDTPSAAAAFIASVLETAAAADAFTRRFLWELIDDDQTAGWTDVLQATTITDIFGFGTAAFAASSFAGAQPIRLDPAPGGWAQIDDTQGSIWTDVLQATTITDMAGFGGGAFASAAFASVQETRLDPAPGGWTRINDASTPAWTEVVT